jgi:hypothetical protein
MCDGRNSRRIAQRGRKPAIGGNTQKDGEAANPGGKSPLPGGPVAEENSGGMSVTELIDLADSAEEFIKKHPRTVKLLKTILENL